MAFRSDDSPMDFEYEHGSGPRDPTSPFPRGDTRLGFGNIATSFPSTSFAQLSASSSSRPFFPTSTPQTTRTHLSGFRDRNETPNSSDGGNDSSPGMGDTEDTPEPRPLLHNITISRGHHDSPIKPKTFSGSAFSGIRRRFSFASKPIMQKKHSQVVKLGHKRKRREIDLSIDGGQLMKSQPGPDNDYDDTEDEQSKSPSKKSPSKAPESTSALAAALAFMHSHPNLPHILAAYGQLLFNALLASAAIYVLHTVYRAVQADMMTHSAEEEARVIFEISNCRVEFFRNKCEPELRAPALENLCNDWEKCMKQDPKRLGGAKNGASTLAEIANSFIEPLSPKLMIFGVSLLVIIIVLPNAMFMHFKRSYKPAEPQTPYNESVLRTPARSMASPTRLWNEDDNGRFLSPNKRDGLPWNANMQSLNTPSFDRRQARFESPTRGERSPVKMLGY